MFFKKYIIISLILFLKSMLKYTFSQMSTWPSESSVLSEGAKLLPNIFFKVYKKQNELKGNGTENIHCPEILRSYSKHKQKSGTDALLSHEEKLQTLISDKHICCYYCNSVAICTCKVLRTEITAWYVCSYLCAHSKQFK